MAKWIAAEKVSPGLRHAVYSVPERDDVGKEAEDDSPKQACPCWFARHS